MAAPNRMNFRKSCKGGGSFVIFNPKIHVADFGNFKQGFLSTKSIQNSNFRVQGIFIRQLYWEKSKQGTDFLDALASLDLKLSVSG